MQVGTHLHLFVVGDGSPIAVPRMAGLVARRDESGSYDPCDHKLSGILGTEGL
jgi:hypothetical protein